MSEEVQATGGALTDEQLSEAFPGQDLGHIRSMMGKMDNATEAGSTPEADIKADMTPENAVEYPDYIPEKFRQGTVEEATAKLAQSYSELEKSRSAPSEKPSEPSLSVPKADATAEADGNPVTMQTAQDEFLKDGAISDATYEGLKGMGLDRGMVDSFIAGQQAIANQLVASAHEAAGGSDAYGDLMEWAAANWTDAEIDAYDSVMEKGDPASINLAIAGLKAARGTSPTLVSGGEGGTGSVAGYESKAEMTTDIKNPQYKTDPAFRKRVEQKLAVSKIW